MAEAVALRPISKLMGKAYKAGETIPADVIASMTPQAVKALVENGHIEVPGMEAGTNSGLTQHMKAKIEAQDAQIKKLHTSNEVLQQSHDDLAGRVAALEAAGGDKPKSKREARAASKE